MEDKFKSTTQEIDSVIEQFVEEKKFLQAKDLYFIAAKQGSYSACDFLAGAYHPDDTVFPEDMAQLFVKNKRKANHFYNRLLKCLRRQAGLNIYPAMFHLYNQHAYGHPRLFKKNRLILAELWLRKAADSGVDIPNYELKMFLKDKCKKQGAV